MVTQQVVAPPARAAVFLVLTVAPGGEGTVRDALTEVSGLVRAVSFRRPEDELNCVIGIGADAWDRLFQLPKPAGLHPFVPLQGARHAAPATPGDLLVHLRARALDLCFEFARLLTDRLGDAVRVVDEVHGFRYFDERDLLGFVDGTENPEGADATAAVLIGDEDPAYAGGSYVIVQKYLHDLDTWNALPVEEQERVIGRHKLDDVELPDAVKPANSHVALNTIEDPDGTERDILRDNMAFGSIAAGEFGTYFIGYAGDVGVTEQMLRNMFLGTAEASHDRILDFSTAVTGGLFFVPTVAFLDDPPVADPASVSAPATAAPAASAPADGSLGIGGLKTRLTEGA
ncbi:Dyp-type peroxidase [Microbacterium luticocti]|uniref:Dyp-type peroxidase n=1 Tax=Microbacterium luticocti TaxID=451764 RepID=UPI0004175BB2|nr:Dyp-type peroxidase [Microbacterium luticocti]